MSRQDGRRYAQVHHDLRDHVPAAVYQDDTLVGAWLKIMLNADAVWPAIAELPRSIHADRFQRLVDLDAVTQHPDDPYRYRMRQLDLERIAAVMAGVTDYNRREDVNSGKRGRAEKPAAVRDIEAFYRSTGRDLGRDLGRPLGTTDIHTDGTEARPAPLPDGAPAASPEEIAEAERRRILALNPNDKRRRDYERENGKRP